MRVPRRNDEPGTLRRLVARAIAWLRRRASKLVNWLLLTLREQPFVLFALLAAFWRALYTEVKSGTRGLFLSFGRAREELEPGPKLMIPFVQEVWTLPTRSRTLDLPAQQVASDEGLVYLVDANVVYRIASVRRALIEIDDVVKGLRQILALSVQQVVRHADRDQLGNLDALAHELETLMRERIEPWGVEIESAGFMSIRPGAISVLVAQLEQRTDARRRARRSLINDGLDPTLATVLAGEGLRVTSRRALVHQRVAVSRRRRRMRKALKRVASRHPKAVGPAERKLVRWLLRVSDDSTDVGRAWARKAWG